MRARLGFLIIVFFLDRLIKNYFWFTPPQDSAAEFLHPVLNDAISFSIHLPGISQAMLSAVLIVIIAWVMLTAVRKYRRRDVSFFWWGCIAVGALSNVLDRYVLGGVLDYIDLGWWPVFNLSDAFITLGVLGLLYRELPGRTHTREG